MESRDEHRMGGGAGLQGEKETWSREKASAFYRETLADAAKVANQSVSSGFEETRRRTFDEYAAFIGQVGQGLTVENARGIDVIAFVHGDWIPKHRGRCRTTIGETGVKTPSASAIKAVIQHVAKSYSMMGRPDAENPAKEEAVKNYQEGFRNSLHAQGVKEKRARVFKESKVTDLVEYLELKVEQAKGIERCVLLMDRAAVLYLWESWARGKECGELEIEQIDFEKAETNPGWTKTVRQEQSGRVELEKGANTFLDSSVELLIAFEQEGVALGRGFLFRPLNKRRNGFADEPLKSAALSRRVKKHLTDAGLFEGETLHSFRRSAVQNAARIEGYDVSRLMQRGRWASYAAFRLYVAEIESCFPRPQ